MRPVFDAKDAEILKERIEAFDKVNGPRVGDFVFVNGDLRRFTHDWGDEIQVTPKGVCGSYYFGKGYASYSGSLDPSIPKSLIRFTGVIKDGRFWFFHHDYHCAHNGIEVEAPCRVYEVSNAG